MKAYFLLLFGMLWSDLGSIKSGFFFNTQANRKNTGKKPYPPITMPLAMLVTALQLHFQSCWRLSTVIPYHSIQRSSNLIEIFLSLWWSSTPTFYVLLENEHFGSLTSLSSHRIPFFRLKGGGVVLHILRQPDLSHFLSWKSTILFIFCKEASSRPRLCVLFWSKGGGPVFNQMAIQSFQTFVADCDCDLMYCL